MFYGDPQEYRLTPLNVLFCWILLILDSHPQVIQPGIWYVMRSEIVKIGRLMRGNNYGQEGLSGGISPAASRYPSEMYNTVHRHL